MQTKDILHLLPCFLHACDCQFFMYILTPTPYFHSFYSTYAAIGSSFLVDAVTSMDMDRSFAPFVTCIHSMASRRPCYSLFLPFKKASWQCLLATSGDRFLVYCEILVHCSSKASLITIYLLHSSLCGGLKKHLQPLETYKRLKPPVE